MLARGKYNCVQEILNFAFFPSDIRVLFIFLLIAFILFKSIQLDYDLQIMH